MDNIINKILLIGWIIVGLMVLLLEKNPTKLQYFCIWLCYIMSQLTVIRNSDLFDKF